MELDEFIKFEEVGLIDKTSIIVDFEQVKSIVDAAYLKDGLATKINYDTLKYYEKLPLWSKSLSKLASNEDVYWFTSDYDDYGVYIGTLDNVLSKIELLFDMGVGDVTIINKNLDTFISFDTYAYQGEFFNEVQFFGEYEILFKEAVIET